jgi:hypothetical protein
MPFRFIAWITLVATLFSTASPTLAAALLRDRPDALRQMLGLPSATAQGPHADEHAHHRQHHGALVDESTDTDEKPSHASHGIYCAFCLNPTSVAAIAAKPAAMAAVYQASSVESTRPLAPRSVQSYPPFRSRAPPSIP